MIAEKQLATVALGLSPQKRARLADLLMQSLVSQKDSEIAEVWHAEAVSRANAYKRGNLKAVSAEEAFGVKL